MARSAESATSAAEEPEPRWVLDGAGLLVHAERFGWFAYPFGPHPPLGPFADVEAARAALREAAPASGAP